ncbi:alpha-N-acetyl-neuraminyl-2,3-beta-galactosyl-1,3-N-acetyl-galactosaminide alpha-2,6-sialyltransferase isoform X1 [Denticeps clupeoides]|uniref:alpha-N-acetyl-neuraminyl-2,3-beta-galactosyl-1, 3-N-acetyl-galactosaminide alpha-2,6-sialyltransferase isoform X1 n=1 Tax=Denticeps clupeoides TaxID=299321 RepID=UPI0010A3FE1D|nr:alpha-N-acetyl-neuraminyl-2,3-beta-galactosyl-1,3-N-acetyl-galactosaminide alpha-2,6-sialyltransferase-like isoform X1 [Denticeps clupeoides]
MVSFSFQRFYWICLFLISLFVLLWYSLLNWLHSGLVPDPVYLDGYMRVVSGMEGKPLSMLCGHCALVSNSGQMHGADLGREIDRRECVIRMNGAPTHGYERDVGNRTTVRMVSHTSFPLLLRNLSFYFSHMKDTVYVVWGPERNMRQDGKGRIFNSLLKLSTKFPQANIYMLTPKKLQSLDDMFQEETGKNRMESGAFLSTGFITMVLALEMCKQVDVYGMIDETHCRRANQHPVPYHYYEKGRLDECAMYRVHERARRGGHRFITEKLIFRRWASTRGRLRFTHPTWSP